MNQSQGVDNEEIRNLICSALREFYIHDADMIDYLSEVPISIRIGMHIFKTCACLEKLGYRVDCEYDKAAMQPKPAPEGYRHKHMRPDILIHKRAAINEPYNIGNLLFCEIKKNNISNEDKEKIEYSLSDDFNYQIAISIHHIRKDSIYISWFEKSKFDVIEKCIKYKFTNMQLVEETGL